jgi:hypothetical protein
MLLGAGYVEEVGGDAAGEDQIVVVDVHAVGKVHPPVGRL